jgi:hypothetical protein
MIERGGVVAVEAGDTSWPRDQLQAELRDEVAGLERLVALRRDRAPAAG